jgi:hypothetical protein
MSLERIQTAAWVKSPCLPEAETAVNPIKAVVLFLSPCALRRLR